MPDYIDDTINVKELSVKRTYTSAVPGSSVQTPAKFILKSESTLGNWCNAIEASINFGTSGAVGGIAGTLSADMILPNQTFPSGEYTTCHLSFGPQASSAWGVNNPVSFLVLENWGTAAEFDSKAFLMHVKGLNEGTGKLFSAGAGALTTAGTLKIKVGATTYYLMLSSNEAN